jgi:hypothetical protein
MRLGALSSASETPTCFSHTFNFQKLQCKIATDLLSWGLYHDIVSNLMHIIFLESHLSTFSYLYQKGRSQRYVSTREPHLYRRNRSADWYLHVALNVRAFIPCIDLELRTF